MNDRNISNMNEQEFDRFLEDIMDAPPSPDMEDSFRPWRKSMNLVLWGVGLSTLTLNFWNLDTILPALGLILMFLGFRGLKQENKWFHTAYITCWIRTTWFMIAFALNLTIYAGEETLQFFLKAGTLVILLPTFLTLVSLRNGIRAVQAKAGLPPHGGNGMLVWYLIVLVLGLIHFTGISVWGLLIAYIFILRNLYLLSMELDEAGYSIQHTPVKISDRSAVLLYSLILIATMFIDYSFFNKYPMNWNPATPKQSSTVIKVRENLIQLGFPAYVLDDMTEEEILSCQGAQLVMVDIRDFDVDRREAIGTQEEINEGYTFVTDAEAERQLQTTYIGIQYGDEREHWKIIHHFRWLTDKRFCGTEALQLWPTDSNEGWSLSSDMTGRVLFDQADETFASPYHSLGRTIYQKNSMFGVHTANDVFAAFSYPAGIHNARGYVMYDAVENIDGYIINSWCNYIHQRSQVQFPVQTAVEFEQTSFWKSGPVFTTIQHALQMTTHEEAPEFFS